MRRPSAVRIGMFWRFGSRQAAGGGNRLRIGGVHPAVRVGQQRQRVDVGGLQLGDLPMLQDQADHLVLVPELLEDRCVGGEPGPCALRARQLQLVEQDLLKLLG